MIIQWIKDYPLNDFLLSAMQEAADQCLVQEEIPLKCSISVRICDDDQIQKINAEYRGMDRSTDVLSFPTVSYPKGLTAGKCVNRLRSEYDDETGACYLGDIVISVPHMIAQAHEYNHTQAREAAYLLVHGICHLMGYDHVAPDEKRNMRRMEEKILEAVSLRRVSGTDFSPEETELIEAAFLAMENSYSPYSHYPVGAAIRTNDARVFTGCNIENASFGLTNCAERTAAFKAVSEGACHFKAIAIAGRKPSWPCGACRQVLHEFSPGDLKIIIVAPGYEAETCFLSDLLPHAFGPNDLNTEEQKK